MRKRSIRVQVWLNKEERIKLQTGAKKSGLSQETYLRVLINGYVPKELPQPDYYTMTFSVPVRKRILILSYPIQ